VTPPVNRYRQLLASVPKGDFYAADGQVIPYRDAPYELRLTTGVPNREYRIYVNGNFRGLVTTNGSGLALVEVLLDRGRNDIRLVDSVNQTAVTSSLTTRDYATWMAAQAQVIEDLDVQIEQVLADSYLATSSTALIDLVFGQTVQTGNDFNYDLNTYRELLQELRTAYRYYGSTLEGLDRVVRAFIQINPLFYPRSFGPSWILGEDFLYPHTQKDHYYLYNTSALTSANSGGAGVSVVAVDPAVGVGSGALKTYGNVSPKRLSWEPPDGNEGPQVNITANGNYTLYGRNYMDSTDSLEEPFQIVSGQNDKLSLEFDDRGILVVTLTAGATRSATNIVTDIVNALSADPRYGVSYSGSAVSVSDFWGSGVGRVSLISPNAAITGSVTIRVHPSADASQTIFGLPGVRSGLNTSVLVGTLVLPLKNTTDMSYWPTPTADNPIEFLIGQDGYHADNVSGGAVTPVSQELVSAIDIDRTAKTLTLASGLLSNHNGNELVILSKEQAFRRENIISDRSITVHVTDFSLLPSGGPFTDAVVISGSGVANGWIYETNAGAPGTSGGYPKRCYFDRDRDFPFTVDEDSRVSIPVPDDILAYRGYTVMISVWAKEDHPSSALTMTTIDELGVSFDDQASYTMSSPSPVGVAIEAPYRPQQYQVVTTIPDSATKMWVRLTTTAGGTGFLIVDKVRVVVPVHNGLYLGEGTTPRDETRIDQGGFTYIWSPNQLAAAEQSSLGLVDNVQSSLGHIDKIIPANLSLDRFDVSEYDIDGIPINIAGAFTEADFLTGTRTNLDVVIRTPARFSHLQPTAISEIVQDLVWTGSGPYLAALNIVADQDMSEAVLLEDGVPVTQDQWQFNSGIQVQLLYTPLQVNYQLRYQSLIRFETAVIDTLVSYPNYLWFGDFHVFLRPEINPQAVAVTNGIQFDTNGIARLTEQANPDQTLATLIEDTGLVQRVIPTSNWNFIDNQRIRISPLAFRPAALYRLSYQAQVSYPATQARVKVELRSATTSVGVGSSTYAEIRPNAVVGHSFRYHQLRVTLSHVRDIRDARIQSLLLKGLHLFEFFSPGGSVPILRP
jgi:hypothetical protein